MFESVKATKRCRRITLSMTDFKDSEELSKVLSLKGKANTFVRVGSEIFRIDDIKRANITFQLEGSFVKVAQAVKEA